MMASTEQASVPAATSAAVESKPLTRTDIAFGVFYGMLLFSLVAGVAGLVIGLITEMMRPIGQ